MISHSQSFIIIVSMAIRLLLDKTWQTQSATTINHSPLSANYSPASTNCFHEHHQKLSSILTTVRCIACIHGWSKTSSFVMNMNAHSWPITSLESPYACLYFPTISLWLLLFPYNLPKNLCISILTPSNPHLLKRISEWSPYPLYLGSSLWLALPMILHTHGPCPPLAARGMLASTSSTTPCDSCCSSCIAKGACRSPVAQGWEVASVLRTISWINSSIICLGSTVRT